MNTTPPDYSDTPPHAIPLPIEHRDHPARRAAKAYCRKCWWASYEDLEQEAFRATCEAMRTFDARVGVPIDAYLFRAAVLALKPVVLRDSAPVSEKRRRLDSLKGVFRAYSVQQSDRGHAVSVPVEEFMARQPATGPDPEVMVNLASWRARVRERLAALLTDNQQTELAVPVLMGEAESNAVAATAGVDVRTVYNATLRAKRRLVADRTLHTLWREMPT